ncbi:MAG: shikimate kinase, partial [Oscillibacter sp.]|nr:shikimate kinase [Oscillibacter sp.]
EQLADFLLHGDWTGLNVTIPYKKDVVAYCSQLSPLARTLGSVNTLVRQLDGSLYGDNTDAWGFEAMAKRLGVDYAGKKALVLGSGGASVTVQAVLKHLGCSVVVISRSGEDNYDNLSKHADAAVLVNTTPVGMYPNVGVSPVDLDVLPNLQAVLDVVYNPARTQLILDAEARGIPCESGLYMLVGQAVRASEHWTGAEISTQKLEQVWKTVGASMQNLVLIGMPGSGKSTVGQQLAEKLCRTLVDADAEIVKRVGEIPAYFASHGEDAFRKVEAEVLSDLGKQSGLVIATGGGCVTREENYNSLHQNGTIIWVQRDLNKLPTSGRPVSQRDGVQAIFEKRKPMYERFADIAVDNNGEVSETVSQILQALS